MRRIHVYCNEGLTSVRSYTARSVRNVDSNWRRRQYYFRYTFVRPHSESLKVVFEASSMSCKVFCISRSEEKIPEITTALNAVYSLLNLLDMTEIQSINL
jgi:hypothetical protein